ncbi:MAG: hypothetical protein LBU25_10050 [Treponema sp.]|jgi:hypothetical protein|nr:hypothetical protein [Treponema sp.]
MKEPQQRDPLTGTHGGLGREYGNRMRTDRSEGLRQEGLRNDDRLYEEGNYGGEKISGNPDLRGTRTTLVYHQSR